MESDLALSRNRLAPGRLAVRGAVAVVVSILAAACASQPQSSLVRSSGFVSIQLAAAGSGSGGPPASTSPYGDFLAGMLASHERDLSAAADFMMRAWENDPENFVILRRAFLLVAADGRHAEAVRLARRVLKQGPDDGRYPEAILTKLVLAVDRIERGELDAAQRMLDSLPDRRLGKFLPPMLGSWLDLSKGDIEAALATIAPLAENNGLAVLYDLQTALLNDVAGRPVEAEAAYRAAAEGVAKPSLRTTWLVGNFLERQGKTEAAADYYRRFKDGEPGSALFDPALERLASGTRPEPTISGYKAGIAEALFNLANLLSQERAQEQALVQIHLALRLNPRFQLARVLLGEILERQNRDEEAIAAYRAVDPASPFAWMARLRIAEGLERLNRTEEAISELEALAAERTAHFEPLFRVGNMLRAQERFAEAVEAYDRAFARLGESASPHWSMHYFRGIALERSGKWERAERDLLTALDLQPEQPYVMNYLAYSWVEQETNLEQAEAMLVRAVELREDDGYIVDSLGWVYYRLGEYDKAVARLERAVELRSQDPVINDHLGDAYWKVGRRQEARFQWRRALSLEPEADLVPAIESKIESGLGQDPKDI
jgi:tetratricopeptide (TPR) repeat protein